MCVSVCVCVGERRKERKRETDKPSREKPITTGLSLLPLLVSIPPHSFCFLFFFFIFSGFSFFFLLHLIGFLSFFSACIIGECFGVLVSIAPARWQPAATRHYVAPRPVMQFSAGPLDALLSPLPFFSLPHLRFAEWNPVGIFGVFFFFCCWFLFFFFLWSTIRRKMKQTKIINSWRNDK